ncbi:amino acid ABC transporter ATP-binding protein [Secundilactobacillus kimchicus]|uniref:amino acid ABC transporter ATP-binding protein n=1 Tax=Secundilactobacillus kimchicus TaxID=528209 RepID=UPI0024A882D6|nr:amino acid ABC transporter ATP-binding protein [Secundilactobacillus kimchicus]
MIELKGLTKSFNRQLIFKDLNLRIESGEVIGLIGPSGAGKSTLLRCLNLLETPDSGSLTIDGLTYHAPKISNRQKIQFRRQSSMVFQQFNLFRQKNILGNVSEGLVTVKGLSRSEAQKVAVEQIQRVRLADHINKYPGQLSGGQKQRVGIARALAMGKNVLLLDEPTSALDTELVGDVLDTIKDVIRQDTSQTVIIISHELSFIKEVASRVLFFDQGQILEDGSPSDVFDHPQNDRVKQFLQRYQARAI